MRRYYNENSYVATLRDAYMIYVAHYNRYLDLDSFKTSDTERLRLTKICKPTKCMKMGSLITAMRWVQWNLEHGPHSEWYINKRCRRQMARIAKTARDQRLNRKTRL